MDRQLWLILLLLSGLAIRLAWVIHLPRDVHSLTSLPDQAEYLQLARHWLATGTFSFHDARFDQDIFAYRTPGYPAFIALCGGSIGIVRIVQALIDASSILGIYFIARDWLGGWRMWIAPGLVAFNPWLIYFSGLLLGETLFVALLVWGMVLLMRRRHIAGCVVLIAGVLVRPSSALLPTFLSVVALWSSLAVDPEKFRVREDLRPGALREGARNTLLAVLIPVLLTVAALLPWAIRNHHRLGSWIWLTTNGGITLYDGFNPSADGGSNQAFVAEMPGVASMGEVMRNQYFQQQATDFIQSHPASAARLVLLKIVRTWSPFPLSESYRSNMRYVLAGAIYTVPFFVLTLIGLWRGSLTVHQRVFLLTPAIYITIVHGLTVGSLRYRIPADVPMAVIAASAFAKRATVGSPITAVG